MKLALRASFTRQIKLVSMYLFYSLVLSFFLLIFLPYYIYQSIRHGKYSGNFRQRMGRLPESVRGDGRAIWIHTVSVGEFNAARPLIASLKQAMPGRPIVVSTTTLTGQRLAASERPGAFDGLFYFPFDWRFVINRTIDHVNPAAVIILETELWPNFLRACRQRSIPTLVVNGRISARSFSRYSRVRPFITRVMQDISLLIMQSEEDAERARSLGAPMSRVRVCGNLKYDMAVPAVEIRHPAGRLREELDDQFALSSSPRLIVAGSTAPGEESVLLDLLKEVRACAGLEGTRLVIAPRRPERFDEVANLIAQSGLKFSRRSRLVAPTAKLVGGALATSEMSDVILLDTIGELASLYEFASVVFVGGSLVPRGGHNIIEPAAYGKPIIVGPHTENFRQIVSDFVRADALIQINTTGKSLQEELSREAIRLLSDTAAAQEMGIRARAIIANNRGATDCTVAQIRRALGQATDKRD